MSEANKTIILNQADYAQLQQNVSLQASEIAQLKQELAWFKKQLFGQKSEKRVFVDNNQLSLFERAEPTPPQSEKKELISYERRQPKQRPDNCVTEQGLRFDDSVPVEVIEIEHPALKGDDAADYTLIDTKVSHRC